MQPVEWRRALPLLERIGQRWAVEDLTVPKAVEIKIRLPEAGC